MPNKITLRKVGSSTGLILPKAALERLHLQEGDDLYLVETPNGLELTPYDPEFDTQMQSARKVLKKYRNTLRELAR